MTTVSELIQNIDEAICRNIESLADQRALLSQNILSQLRNLVEGVAVHLHTGSPDAEFNYAALEPGLAFVRSNARLNFLGKFHKLELELPPLNGHIKFCLKEKKDDAKL